MTRLGRRWRVAAGLVLLLLSATAEAVVGADDTAELAAPSPVPIVIEATRDILVRQSSPWLDAFSESELTQLSYRSVSSATARRSLLAGETDAAIAGGGFTAAELAESGRRAEEFVAVPVHVSAAMLLLSEPFSRGFGLVDVTTADENPLCDPLGDDYDQSLCEVRTPFTGAIRVPPRNLAAMMLNVNTDGLRTWRHPDVLAALGAPTLDLPASDAPTFVHREPGESVNEHLQRYVVTAAPEVWELAKHENPGVEYQVDDSVPRAFTRSSPTFQAQQVGLWQVDPKTGGATTSGWAGNMAGIPPAAKGEVQEVYPLTPYRVVEVRNATGEYVAPTPASIEAAVAAGGRQPLYALDHPVAGAYPLVWVDHLYVPATGLTPDKVNGLASIVRHLVTRGQEGASALGEGQLPDALVGEALDAANDLVRANCTGDDHRVVVETDGTAGPWAPPDLDQVELGEVVSCRSVRRPAMPSPAVVPAPEPTIAATPAPPATEPPAPSSTTTTTAVPRATPVIGAEGTPAAPAAEPEAAGAEMAPSVAADGDDPVERLPLAVPAAVVHGLDAFTTTLLGAALFLVLRNVVARRRRVAP